MVECQGCARFRWGTAAVEVGGVVRRRRDTSREGVSNHLLFYVITAHTRYNGLRSLSLLLLLIIFIGSKAPLFDPFLLRLISTHKVCIGRYRIKVLRALLWPAATYDRVKARQLLNAATLTRVAPSQDILP